VSSGVPSPGSSSPSTSGPGAVYQFIEFRLDCGRFELLRKGRPLRVERKPLELLTLLVSRQGQLVSRTEIAERLWSSEVFVDTEHGINTAIRKLRHLLRDDSDDPRFIQTVTGKGYRFVAPVTAMNGSQSEAASMTASLPLPVGQDDQTEKQDVAMDALAANAAKARRFWIVFFACAAGLIAIIALTMGSHSLAVRLLRGATAPVITSLAVLPLDNLSGDAGQDYFADGMTDELITMLAKNSSLRVTSRTSVMQYKRVHRPLRQIARELGVDGILEGSISRSGERVHMTLQFIRADTDTHLWAESYDRGSSDVPALPREAARDIANRLHSSLASTIPIRYVNPAAHDAYLQGRYFWWEGNIDGALPYFKKAVELQPDYALAWFGLSSYYGAGAMFGNLDPRQSLPLVDLTASKCLQLDSSASECHLAMGADDLVSKWNFEEGLREISRAIELDPKNAEAFEIRSRILQALNRNEGSIQAEKISIELNPANPWGFALALWRARRYDEALTDVQQRMAATPRDPTMQLFLAAIYRGKGMDKESIECLEKFYRYSEGPASAESLHRAFQSGGVKAAVEWQIRFVKAGAARHYVSPVDLSELYAQLGDREQTLALLEEALRQHAPGLLWIQGDSAYDFLHGNPRYRSLIQRIGVPAAY
jgi:TolB-like protein/DNA-binding winged helix-turn-helix (wHTH) protein/lipoprotein NlpI